MPSIRSRWLALVYLLSVAPLPASAQTPKPNVILILSDDQGYGDFSCHGNPILKTPNLDKLHGESLRLTDFHVGPMCTPTRGQLLTGRSALANGAMCVSCGRTPLRRGIPTMADVFKASGYRTAHFGKWHLGDSYPFRPIDRGFEESITCRSWGVSSAADQWNNDCFDDTYLHNGTPKQFPGYNTDVFFNQAMNWMKARKEKQERFFVYLPLTAAHGPHFVPEKYKKPYANLKPNVAGFFGMIANLDENIGRLEAFLQEQKLRDNTILIFLTDNGGTAGVPIFNAGMRGRKMELYEGGHRVPCFIRWPSGDLRAVGDIPNLTQAQDLLPTLIELCELTRPPVDFDGMSLAPLLQGRPLRIDDRVLIVQYASIRGAIRPQKGEACVMWGRWRLVNDKELYNLDTDPEQKQNVFKEQFALAQRLRVQYNAWWNQVEPGLDRFEPLSVGSAAEPLVRLTPADWEDVHCDQSAQSRRGENKNGRWHILVERAGTYEITLRRYPKEADLPVTAAAPAHKGELGNLPEGKALPIARARVRFDRQDEEQPVKATDKGITFRMDLKPGVTRLQTWFYDDKGMELCGAYYTDVQFIK